MNYTILLIMLLFPLGCDKQYPTPIPLEYQYTYSEQELDLMAITNQYRESQQLSTLTPIEHIGHLCKEHNLYMIKKDTTSHDYFYDRQVNLQQLYRATRVGEIIAYNYQTNQAVLQAWINSPIHFATLVRPGYTNFGVSIVTNPINKKKYYTFIFIAK